MEVRDVRWEDFGDITANYWALYEEVSENPDLGISLFAQKPTLGEEALWFARLLREVEQGTRVVQVAVAEGKVVGLCEVNRRGTSPEMEHVAVLGLLVARGHRGRGVGRALLTRTLERCRGKFVSVELLVLMVNEPARHLYRSVGFRAWGVEPRAVRRNGRFYDAEHMMIDLDLPQGSS